MMFRYFRNRIIRWFLDDDGAVTVDWIVLTAAITGIGAVVALSVAEGAAEHAGKIGASLTDADVVALPTY